MTILCPNVYYIGTHHKIPYKHTIPKPPLPHFIKGMLSRCAVNCTQLRYGRPLTHWGNTSLHYLSKHKAGVPSSLDMREGGAVINADDPLRPCQSQELET